MSNSIDQKYNTKDDYANLTLIISKTSKNEFEVTHGSQVKYRIKHNFGMRGRGSEYFDPAGNLVCRVKFPSLMNKMKGKDNPYLLLDVFDEQLGSIPFDLSNVEYSMWFHGMKFQLANLRIHDHQKFIDLTDENETVAATFYIENSTHEMDEPPKLEVHNSDYELFSVVFMGIPSIAWPSFQMKDFPDLDLQEFSSGELLVPEKETFLIRDESATKISVKPSEDDITDHVAFILLVCIVIVPIGLWLVTDSGSIAGVSFIVMLSVFIIFVILFPGNPGVMKFEHEGKDYLLYKKGDLWHIEYGLEHLTIQKYQFLRSYWMDLNGPYKLDFEFKTKRYHIIPITDNESLPIAVQIYDGNKCVFQMIGQELEKNRNIFYKRFSIHYDKTFNMAEAMSFAIVLATLVFKYVAPPSSGH